MKIKFRGPPQPPKYSFFFGFSELEYNLPEPEYNRPEPEYNLPESCWLRPTEVLTFEVEMFPLDKVLYFNQENNYTGFVYNYV